jgi:hypothetical protein
MQHEREAAGKREHVQPEDDNLDFVQSARPFVIAREVGVRAKELLEIFKKQNAAQQGGDEQYCEPDADGCLDGHVASLAEAGELNSRQRELSAALTRPIIVADGCPQKFRLAMLASRAV